VILTNLKRRIIDTVSRANGNLQGDVEQVVKSTMFNETKRRPMVVVTVSRV
jgi:mRNA degradation ribonuclease J1/J2